MSQLKRASLWAGATIVAGTGLKDLLLSALFVVGAPATTAGFVYEVMELRQAQLKREADDRDGMTTSQVAQSQPPPNPYDIAPPPGDEDIGPPQGGGAGAMDLPHRIASMLRAREHFLDLYGGNPEAVTPVYQGVMRDMLEADDKLLAKIDTATLTDRDAPTLRTDVAHLRDLHSDLAKLARPGP